MEVITYPLSFGISAIVMKMWRHGYFMTYSVQSLCFFLQISQVIFKSFRLIHVSTCISWLSDKRTSCVWMGHSPNNMKLRSWHDVSATTSPNRGDELPNSRISHTTPYASKYETITNISKNEWKLCAGLGSVLSCQFLKYKLAKALVKLGRRGESGRCHRLTTCHIPSPQ